MPRIPRFSVEDQRTSDPTNAEDRKGGNPKVRRFTWKLSAALLLWIAVAMMAAPLGGSVPLGSASYAHQPLAPVAQHVGPASHVSHVATGMAAADAALPGTDSSKLLPAPASTDLNSLHLTPGQFAALNRERARLAYNASHPAAPAAPHPGISIPTGTFTGYINWSIYPHKGLAAVTVQAFAQTAGICPITTCAAVSSDATGYFSVVAPVGNDYVTFTAGWNVTNRTFAYASLGITTYIGTTYMVPTAFGHVLLLGDTPTHPGVAGVQINSAARDASFFAIPTIYSSSNGSAIFPVLPFPSKITFVPPSGWQENFTWANGTPLEQVCVGVVPKCIVYLEPQVRVHAQLYDAITHNPIYAASAFRVCPIGAGSCVLQGNTVGGPNVVSFAPSGPSFGVFDAVGYMVNKTFIGNIPRATSYTVPGDPAHPGRVYLVPEGQVRGYVNLSANRSVPWGTGLVVASVCGMNGYKVVLAVPGPFGGLNLTEVDCDTGTTCFPINTQVTFYGPALRSNIIIVPDTGGSCSPFGPTWPIPGDAPVWGNETWVNLTPGAVLPRPIPLNLTVGSYTYGNVFQTGTTRGLNATFCATAVSTDNPGLANYPYCYNPLQPGPWDCPTTTTVREGSSGFCSPAPPGPYQIKVSDSPYYNVNWTWGYHQPLCCNTSAWELPLSIASANHYQSINLSQNPAVNGTVFINGTHLPVFFATVTVCSATSNPLFVCTGSVANTTGTFVVAGAPPGWDVVTIAASGFSPNRAWVNATGTGTVSVGTIYLTALAYVTGQVVDPTGHGLYDASVHYCQAASAIACFQGSGTTLGTGLTSTNGMYNGSVPGGWLPWSTYALSVSAPGYSTDWTWFNATPGGYVLIPTIRLNPVGTNQSSTGLARGVPTRAAPTFSSVPAAGVWVDGRVVDNWTGWGIPTPNIAACDFVTQLCTPFADGANYGGYFNWSVAPSLYNLTITADDYYPVSIFFNASAAGAIHFSTIQMRPLSWVHGRAIISPWYTLKIPTSKTTWLPLNLGPGASARACDEHLLTCGLAEPIDTAGFFTVATPVGNYNRVDVIPSFTGGDSSATGGFVRNSTSFNITNESTNLSGTLGNATTASMIPLEVFAAISLHVADNSTFSAKLGKDRVPVRDCDASIATVGTNNAGVAWTTNMGGDITFFLPGGNANNSTVIRALLPLSFLPLTEFLPIVIAPGEVVVAPNLSMVHYGWEQFSVVNPATHLGVPFISVLALPLGPTAPAATGMGQTNWAGQVNVTAPPYRFDNFTIGPAADYNSTNFTAWINTSTTTLLNSTTFGHIANVSVPPWGWIRSVVVNATPSPNLVTVIDNTNLRALPGASVVASSWGGSFTGTGEITNWAGQFLTDAPIGMKDQLYTSHFSYLSNLSTVKVHPGEEVQLSTINMTADGIIAGQVLSNPGNVAVGGATVTVCPVGGRVCTNVITNSSGLWWDVAAPGSNDISVSAPGFVPNTGVGHSTSDVWTWMGTVTVDQYAYLTGTVRGLPSGIPIANASVSACSPFGTPVGPCGFSVNTTPLGSFLLPVPAGSYVMQTAASFYNSSYLPLSLTPGEHVYLGTIFLEAYGYLSGVVYSGSTFSPLFNASVYACPVWSGQGCSATAHTDASGRYTAFGPPGQYAVTATSPSYHDATIYQRIGSGNVSAAPTIYLYPIGTSTPFPVTGKVLAAGTTHTIPDATVAALTNGTLEFSTTTNSSGSFNLPLVWGQYNLTAYAPGYHPAERFITVNGPVANQVLVLSIMTYTVSGVAEDALTHTAVPGVVISENGGLPLATTDANGAYSIDLANGTHALVAAAPPFGGVTYAVVPFLVTVNGADQRYPIALLPPTAALYGTVADFLTALPIANASVRLAGTTIDGIPLVISLQSNAVGEFTVNIPQGSYSVAASSTGYQSKVVHVEANASAAQVTLTLVPYSTTASQANSPWIGTNGLWLLAAVVIGLIGATFLVGFFAGRGRRRPTTIAPRRPPPGATGGKARP